MKIFAHHSLLIAAGFAAISLAAACDSGGGSDDDDDSGGSSGTGGTTGATGGSGGSGTCTPGGDTLLLPTTDGWVDKMDPCNDVGVQGSWYPYGDQYGDGEGDSKCTKFGGHASSECAVITFPPPPPATGFENIGGAMRTTGTVESILPCVAGSMAATLITSGCPGNDYSSMWGAGIGFDLNADKGEDGGAKHTWDPDAQTPPVVGISFNITGVPLGNGLRVEFPMQLTAEEAAADSPPITIANPTTDSHSAGAPYWGAQANGDGKFPKSNVVEGENKVYFNDGSIESPKVMAYKFDKKRMLGIQFHVVAGSPTAYDFTVSNLKFLRQ